MKKGFFAFQEVAALRLIRPHVIIPVPFVLDAVGVYFIMTGLRGEPLDTVFSKMQPDEVARVRESPSKFIRQRAIPNDAPGVVSGPHHYMPCCDVTNSKSVLSPPLPPFTRIYFHLFPRNAGKRLRRLLRKSIRNLIPSTLRTGT